MIYTCNVVPVVDIVWQARNSHVFLHVPPLLMHFPVAFSLPSESCDSKVQDSWLLRQHSEEYFGFLTMNTMRFVV